jgi:hypothetical protein
LDISFEKHSAHKICGIVNLILDCIRISENSLSTLLHHFEPISVVESHEFPMSQVISDRLLQEFNIRNSFRFQQMHSTVLKLESDEQFASKYC